MTEPPTPTRRMTLSHVVEVLLQRPARERSSVTLSRNAKGDTQIEVVVRTGEHATIQTPEEALAKAVELYDSARDRYPMQTVPLAATTAPRTRKGRAS